MAEEKRKKTPEITEFLPENLSRPEKLHQTKSKSERIKFLKENFSKKHDDSLRGRSAFLERKHDDSLQDRSAFLNWFRSSSSRLLVAGWILTLCGS